jgi:hypothetical protein
LKQFDEITHVIKTLLKLRAQIILCVETLNEIIDHNVELEHIKLDDFLNYDVNLGQSCYTLVSNHFIILSCSFLDEYESYFNIHNLKDIDSQRILRVRIKNKPGLDRIKKWKDFKNFRNYFAVHNFRIKGKSFFSDDIGRFTIKIPNTPSEKKLFAGIVNLICLNILNEFDEVAQLVDIEENMLDKITFIEEHIDATQEFHDLKNRMS